MEWVEETGRSVEEAIGRALAQLGVTENDAEVVVLTEPKTGLFGRVRGEARVRARVRPAQPRPKRVRKKRERGEVGVHGARTSRSGSSRGTRRAGGGSRTTQGREAREPSETPRAGMTADESASDMPVNRAPRRRGRRGGARRLAGASAQGASAQGASAQGTGAAPAGGDVATGTGEGRREGRQRGRDQVRPDRVRPEKEGEAVAQGITLQEQAAVAKEFLEGLLDRYGLKARIEVREVDDETVELAAHGEGLGVLVGPKGATVAALQDVTRTVVQRHFPNRTDRILVDVAGYRERRAAALRRFAADVAAEVLESGTPRALEPMNPADRKVIHDTVLTIDGVVSGSQGEEPNRFVVISPAP